MDALRFLCLFVGSISPLWDVKARIWSNCNIVCALQDAQGSKCITCACCEPSAAAALRGTVTPIGPEQRNETFFCLLHSSVLAHDPMSPPTAAAMPRRYNTCATIPDEATTLPIPPSTRIMQTTLTGARSLLAVKRSSTKINQVATSTLMPSPARTSCTPKPW